MDAALPFGFNVTGYASCNIGLGIAARNTVEVLVKCGYRVAVYDVMLPGRSGADNTFRHLQADASKPPEYAINVFHINPPQLELIRPLIHEGFWSDRLNVCVPFWELPRIPDSWAPVFKKCHLVLAPSMFIGHAVSSCCGCRVIHYPQTVFIDETIKPDRDRFSLPQKTFLFIISFDIGSDLLRKNPTGAIDAFNQAFVDKDTDVGLIIKINRTVTTPVFNGFVDKLRGYIASNPKIRIIDSSMSYKDILALYASCDCYVSLHRAEGLGLGIMESMALGKPVIATFWSGTTDFMTPQNSCMVSYKIVRCDPLFNPNISPGNLGFQGLWAEPDHGDAITWMRELVHNPEHRRQIGDRARLSMAQRNKTVLEGSAFRMVEALYGQYLAGIYS